MGEIVVAITGASGAIYGKRLLEILQDHGRDTRLVESVMQARLHCSMNAICQKKIWQHRQVLRSMMKKT